MMWRLLDSFKFHVPGFRLSEAWSVRRDEICVACCVIRELENWRIGNAVRRVSCCVERVA